jgi:L-rhamnose mutarotase
VWFPKEEKIMRRVQEIIYIVPEEREAFLERCLHPTKEIKQIYWQHGVRYQYYFAMNDLILMTFEYVGNDFYKDMDAIADYPEMHKYMVRRRRKDVPLEERATTSWWAPLKKLGVLLTVSPMDEEDEDLSEAEQYHSMTSGSMVAAEAKYDITFDDDDWSDSIHI